jgi:phage gp29-like protein
MTTKKNNITIKKTTQQPIVIIQSLTVRPTQRSTDDIVKWKQAIQSADMGRRVPLYNLYEGIMLDTRITSVVEKRVLGITNSQWVFVDDAGKDVDDIKKIIDSPAFETILEEIQNAIIYGHSLLECGKDAEGNLVAELIPRKHVKQELGIVIKNENDTTGIAYREPPTNYYVLEVGNVKDYGLLLKATPYVIFKKGNFSDWAQYAELFGMPQRVGKYDINDVDSKIAMERSLEDAGSASWISVPKDTDITVNEGKGAGDGGKLYHGLKDACNEEITILFLGQTMTTDDGASKAQGQVHLAVEESLHKKDRRRARRILNQYLVPILANLGYPVGNGTFDVKEDNTLSTKERLDILNMVDAKTPVADDEYYTTSGVPKPVNYDELVGARLALAPSTEVDNTKPKPPSKPADNTKAKPATKAEKLSLFDQFKNFFDQAE